LFSAKELIAQIAERIDEVVVCEEHNHRIISAQVASKLAAQCIDSDIIQLIEALQYYDRLQQRTHALCELLRRVADQPDNTQQLLNDFRSTVPVAVDASWVNELYPALQEIHETTGAQEAR